MDVASFLEDALARMKVDFMEEFERQRKLCGSPIEELMLAALMERNVYVAPVLPGGVLFYDTPNVRGTSDLPIITAHQQSPVGGYLADFLFRIMDKGLDKTVVVECDGHDFHERTKEQAAHDRSRDRYMATNDITVLRFTGSEIWKNPRDCARQVFAVLIAIADKEPEKAVRLSPNLQNTEQ